MVTAIVYALLAVHAGLGLWALTGLAELVWAEPPWPRISNPLFSVPVLLGQWVLSLLAAAIFLGGYATAWSAMPRALAATYALMAALCAYQNFRILEHDGRFMAMAVEYLAYVAILAFLFLTPAMRTRFGM